MLKSSPKKKLQVKRDDIIRAALKLFSEKGYEETTVRDIVSEANTSMGNLYFHFSNKQNILEFLCSNFVDGLREQISKIHDMSFSPEVGFALDFKIGYLATLEDETFSRIFIMARKTPDIHKYSLQNKRIRLQTFFGDQIADEELDTLAVAIQGIADAIFEQKCNHGLNIRAEKLSNAIIDYSLRLMGYSQERIQEVIDEANQYIRENNITPADLFTFPELVESEPVVV